MAQVATYSGAGKSLSQRIFFRVYQRGGREDQDESRSYDDPSEVERVALEYIQKGMYLATTSGQGLGPERCFDEAVRDGTYTVVVVPHELAEINRLRVASGVGSVATNEPHQDLSRRKRKITER
jgi:hypothetical protein